MVSGAGPAPLRVPRQAEGEVFNTPARQRSLFRFVEGLIASLAAG